MKIKLKNNKSITFLDGTGEINTNDVMRQLMEVELETPLATGESLWIVYAASEFAYTGEILFQEDVSGYKMLIPEEVLKMSGEWSMQLFVRLYSTTDPTKYITQFSSDIASFTVQDGLPTENGLSVNSATVGNLWNEAKKNAASALNSAERAEEAYDRLINVDLPNKYVTVDTNQTISGNKTHTGINTFNGFTSINGVGIDADAIVKGSDRFKYPVKSGTLALTSDIPENIVTTDTDQTIDGTKAFTSPITVGGQTWHTVYMKDSFVYTVDGNNYEVTYPEKSGTMALKSDIPTDYVTQKEFEDVKRDISDIYTIIGETVYLLQPLTQAYTSRETAAGTEIIDGALTTVQTIEGSTVKTTNLIPYPYVETTKTVNGVTFTDNGDGSITVNGTATASVTFVIRSEKSPLVFNPGKNYYLRGCPSGGSSESGALYALIIQTIDYANSFFDYGNGKMFIPQNMGYYAYIAVYTGASVNNLVFRPIINEGTTALPYQLYFKGLKNASFEKIVSTGENLCGGDNVLKNKVIANAETGNIINSNSYDTLFIPVKIGENYRLTGFVGDNGRSLRYVIYDQFMNVIYYYDSAEKTVTIPESGAYLGCSYYNQNAEVMCERGTTATAYEPYKQSVLSLPSPVENPAYNTLDFQTGKNVSQGATKVFDGTEGWSVNTTYTAFSCDLPVKGIAFTSVCSRYDGENVKSWSALKDFEAQNGELVLLVKDSRYTTVAEWKAYLAAQYAAGDPLIVRYKTVTATETDLNADYDNYQAWNGGSETVVQGDTDNSEYGAENTVSQEYPVKGGGTI